MADSSKHSGGDKSMATKSLTQYSTSEHELQEARYMGALDFATWILNHDESSFRQERAWFKIKPKLLMEYRAELLEGLKYVRSNIGLDPNAKVRQIKHVERADLLATDYQNQSSDTNDAPKGAGKIR
jgi:hypothetical protein